MKLKVYCSLPQQTCLRFVGFSAEWLTAHWNDITIMCQHVNWHFAVKMSMICPVVQKQTPLLSAITFQTIWQINYIPDVRCLKMVLSCHLSVIKLSTPCVFLFIFLFSQSSSLKSPLIYPWIFFCCRSLAMLLHWQNQNDFIYCFRFYANNGWIIRCLWSVCVFVCEHGNSKSCGRTWLKFWDRWPGIRFWAVHLPPTATQGD